MENPFCMSKGTDNISICFATSTGVNKKYFYMNFINLNSDDLERRQVWFPAYTFKYDKSFGEKMDQQYKIIHKPIDTTRPEQDWKYPLLPLNNGEITNRFLVDLIDFILDNAEPTKFEKKLTRK